MYDVIKAGRRFSILRPQTVDKPQSSGHFFEKTEKNRKNQKEKAALTRI